MKTLASVVLTVLCALPVMAQTTKFGEWRVGRINDGTGVYAATINDSGNVFGKYCYASDRMCYWTIIANVRCEVGSNYPALINGQTASVHVKTTCLREVDENNFTQVIHPFDDVESQVTKSNLIGLAVPMESGAFRVFRWSTDGAMKAIEVMEERLMKMPSKSTKDLNL